MIWPWHDPIQVEGIRVVVSSQFGAVAVRAGVVTVASLAWLIMVAAAQAQTAQPVVSALDPLVTAQPAVPETPFAQAMSRQLSRSLPLGGEDLAGLRADYSTHRFAPLWLSDDDLHAPANALIKALEEADSHGLPTQRYQPEELRARVAALVPAALEVAADQAAALDLELSLRFLAYARDVGTGMIDPRVVPNVYVERAPRPAAELLGLIRNNEDTAGVLGQLPPRTIDYMLLREALRIYRKRIHEGGWGTPIPGNTKLEPGTRDGRVALLRARLALIGDYLPKQTPRDPSFYDPELVEATIRFQERHGLEADGVTGPATIAAMNVAPALRVHQILVNLERARWINRPLGHRHILVNLAGYEMQVFENDNPIFGSRVVVGKAPDHQTPEFFDQMTHIVVNPYWHVPPSIAGKELLPLIKNNPGYLDKNNMILVTNSGQRVDPYTVNFHKYTERNFPFMIKQLPGEDNSLGQVKFIFPNHHNIYLHDTPAKKLFDRAARAFSHGCVRVARPKDLAHVLLGFQSRDPEAVFARALSIKREQHLRLSEALPVYLTYRTAWVDAMGRIQFRDDVYGRDAHVLAGLRNAGVIF